MSNAPTEVFRLVERFQRNRESYKSPAYNETQVRHEFIDPLFMALGWDVNNEQGLAEAYKDVIHEDAIKVGGATKAPDYCFRIGGTRKFFVEAKKPAVGLSRDQEPAYQLRRYAWSSKLPLSILTDFEEFAVYDGRIRPKQSDKASTGRVFYCTFGEYEKEWEWIAGHFSKDAILKGAFDRYAESTRRKRGTAEVDTEFLKEIEQWREHIAANFALRNPGLAERELNFAVQRTIDRIIFLRMCEDRSVEPYGQLLALCAARSDPSRDRKGAIPSRDREGAIPSRDREGASIDADGDGAPTKLYQRLAVLFRRADERYNSSLFYFTPEAGREPPDELTLSLKLDDKVLRETIKSLYYPQSPYEFSVLPPEILGQVYEQFLGKVIRLTKGHRAKVEEKPEVRKAGGVYYTPAYIVDYIVKHTVGKLLEGKTPAQVGLEPNRARKEAAKRRRGKQSRDRKGATRHPLRILDPACGSGSFLLGAYQYLLDWHLKWYCEDDPEKHARSKNPPIVQRGRRDWRLTIAERKRILLNNIYGVDIDHQAVETTKLSLLLKVLEGETSETIGQTLRLFHERALPDLCDNIKCGNSLIGPDFYENRQLFLLDEEERYRINVFDWHAEFPEVFQQNRARKEAADSPGFDAVIGNPPYLKEYTYTEPFQYLRCTHLCKYYQGKMDLWYAFGCWSIDLLRLGGLHSFIATNNWVTNSGASLLRAKLRRETRLCEFVDFGDFKVFPGVGIQTMIYVLQKTSCEHTGTTRYRRLDDGRASQRTVEDFLYLRSGAAGHTAFEAVVSTHNGGSPVNFVDQSESKVLSKLESGGTHHLHKSELTQGIVAPQDSVIRKHLSKLRNPRIKVGDGIFVLRDEEIGSLGIPRQERELLKPYYTTGELHRYYGSPKNKYWVIYTTSDARKWIDKYPNIRTHLRGFASVITSHYGPYGLHRARDQRFFRGNTIVSLRKTKRVHFTITRFPCYVSQTFNVIKTDRFRLEFLLGVLNSRLATYWFSRRGKKQGDLLQVDTGPLLMFPICQGGGDKADHLVSVVQQMLDLHKQLSAAKMSHEKTAIQRQIDATDRRIDKLVYELYDLTDEEIHIVEEATDPNRSRR